MPFVYKISSPSTDKVYIGSTIRTLHLRFLQHKRDGNHTRSKEIITLGDAVIELIEEVTIHVLKQRERFHIESMKEKCVNYQIPLRTQKEWCEDNKDYVKEYHHTLYAENKEKIDAQRKLNYEKNKDKYLERQRQRWNENIDIENEKRRMRYANMEIITCECGSSYKKKVHIKHSKTKKHLDYLGKLI
jgi:hypothetical protein